MVESFTDKRGPFLSPLVLDIYVVTYCISQRLLCCSASCVTCDFPLPSPPRLLTVPLLYDDARLAAVKPEPVGRGKVFRGVLLDICRPGLGSKKENYSRKKMHRAIFYSQSGAP